MRAYMALMHKVPDTGHGVSFSDLPGCISVGDSMGEARALAAEALALHLEGLAQYGEALPEPSSIEAVMVERENRDEIAILADAPRNATRSVRINITLPAGVLDEIDRYAEMQCLTRSEFLARAARNELLGPVEGCNRRPSGRIAPSWWRT